jgi:ribosomal-protein-alanine N-acetyltransferase
MVRPGVRLRQQFRKRFLAGCKPLCRLVKAGWRQSVRYNGGVNFTLRDFRPEDFEVLWRIDQECFAPGIAYSRMELATYVRRRGSFAVVAKAVVPNGMPANSNPSANDKFQGIVGFIVAEASRRGTGHIISIDVLPEGRRRGIGSELLRAAEERLRGVLCHTVVLETGVDNLSALAFYKRHHYSVVKIVPRYYPNGVDAFLMDKNLLPVESGRCKP